MSIAAASESPAPRALEFRALVLLWCVGLALFGLRLASPSDLPDNDQERPASYVLDVVCNGHWIVQRDVGGDITSKPPLYTWLAATAAVVTGSVNRFTLYLPCGLTVLGAALLIGKAARTHFGTLAGLLGGLSFFFCQYGYKHVVLARTDALFAFLVTAAALAGYRAWSAGRGWTGFWLLAAGASLTKGPLGLMLAAGGLLAAGWEWRSGRPARLRGLHWSGPLLWLGLVGGWFALAYAAVGDELVRKMVVRELAGHVTGADAGGLKPFSQPFHAWLYFLSRYLPWSLFACVGFWRVWRRPAASDAERRFERFLFCWFWLGLLLFTIAPHKRPDLLLPLVPAAAMLAGRELARLLARVQPARVWRASLAGSVAILAAMFAYARWEGTWNSPMTEARAMAAMAAWWNKNAPADVPLTFADPLMTLQFHLQRHQFFVQPAEAAKFLQGEEACFVAVQNLESLRRNLPNDFALHELAHQPADGKPFVSLVSNRPTLAASPAVSVGIGSLAVELQGMALRRASWNDLFLQPLRAGATTTVRDTAAEPVWVGYRLTRGPVERRRLAPGESWTIRAEPTTYAAR